MAFELSPSSFEPGEAAPVELFFSRESRLEMVQGTLETLKQRVEITHSLVGSSSFDAPVKKRKKQELVLTPPITPSLSKNRALLLSFSSLAQKQESEERILQEVESTEDKGPHTLPLGVETGVALHTIFEKIFKRKLHLASCKEERVLLIQQELAKGPLQEWSEVVEEIVTKTLFLSLPCHHGSVSLSELSSARMMQEMEFLFPTGKGMLKGFADLVFEVHGKYYLIDWKSNWLGTDRSAYSDANLKKAMDEHDYFLQGSIYASALERYVKLFDKRPFDELFGGAFYIFLRGEAVYHFKPERDDERFCTKTV
jgi:exodeoxyribonuclease V beta subunit